MTSWLSWPPEAKDDEAEALVVKVPGRERTGSVGGTHIQRWQREGCWEILPAWGYRRATGQVSSL